MRGSGSRSAVEKSKSLRYFVPDSFPARPLVGSDYIPTGYPLLQLSSLKVPETTLLPLGSEFSQHVLDPLPSFGCPLQFPENHVNVSSFYRFLFVC